MNLTVDFETRSFIDIKKSGAWRYAEDASTEVMCLAIRVDTGVPFIWIPDYFAKVAGIPYLLNGRIALGHVEDLVLKAVTLEAHNAEFERAIWSNKMVPLGLPEIPIERWRCSAAKAAACSLPRSLDGAVKALGLPEKYQKDMEGHRIMMRLCKPKKPSKNSPGIWDETPEKLIKLFKYCQQDVIAEHTLSKEIPDLSPLEQQVWFLDQRINQRGFQVDRELVNAVMDMMAEEKDKQLKIFRELTGLNGPRQVQKLKEWCADRYVILTTMDKESVQEALDGELPDEVREVLIVRQKLSQSSTDKYNAFANMVCTDGRLRGSTMFHGAGTGRWAGKGVQPQNMPRKAYNDFELLVGLLIKRDKEMVELLYDSPMTAASKSIRNVITAAPGNNLICADLSAVEGRGLAWLAGEEKILEDYRNGLDPYKVVAATILGIKYEDITKEQRSHPGKTAELACGFGGSVGAAIQFGATGSDKEIKDNIVKPWRENRPETVKFWRALQSAAVHTVQTGETTKVNYIKFMMKGRFLCMRLPSGRLIRYCDPWVESQMVYCYIVQDLETMELDLEFKSKPDLTIGERNPDRDFEAYVIKFWGVDAKTKQWCRQHTYGGKLSENCTQGMCRDFLSEGMLRLDPEFPIVLHVHDEAIGDVSPEKADLERFIPLLTIPPTWAPDCPIDAAGWVGFRYRKD